MNVTFGDMWIKASAPTVKAGKVTFGVKNEGATMHGLAMVSAPAKVEGGMVDHSTFLAKGGDLAGGASETVSADLKPGKYELICHMPGHYPPGRRCRSRSPASAGVQQPPLQPRSGASTGGITLMRTSSEGSIAINPAVARFVDTRRSVVDVAHTNFTDVSAVVLSAQDIGDGVASDLEATGFGLPVFVVSGPDDDLGLDIHGITGVLASDDHNAEFFGRMVDTAATKYDTTVLPPFFGALAAYERRGYSAFDCPGHQGGQFFIATRPGGAWSSSSARTCFAQTCATRT